MEVMRGISSNTDAFYYTSAPTSPRRCNFNGFYFLSMPTSPIRQLSRDLSVSGSRTPETTENSPLCPDYFEFEESRRFCVYDNRYEKSRDFSIAYADELFCDGKMLPLRPPPRAQYTRANRVHGISSTASSPGVRGSTLRVPLFARQRSLWNDGFDPFMAALNKVKDENDVVNTKEEKAQLRRSKSLSPFRWPSGSTRWPAHKNKRLGLSPQRDRPSPMFFDAIGPNMGPREVVGGTGSLESRKGKIKKFLVKNAAFHNREKGEQKTPLLMRKVHNSGSNHNTITRISKEVKKLMKNRARVLSCLVKGFGIKKCMKSDLKL